MIFEGDLTGRTMGACRDVVLTLTGAADATRLAARAASADYVSIPR